MGHACQLVQSGQVPWAAVGVWGWADSPVGWQGMEHSAAHAVGLEGDTCPHSMLLLMPPGGNDPGSTPGAGHVSRSDGPGTGGLTVLVLKTRGAGDVPLPVKVTRGQ